MDMIAPYNGLAEKIRQYVFLLRQRRVYPFGLMLTHTDRVGLASEFGISPEAAEGMLEFEGLVIFAGPHTMLMIPLQDPRSVTFLQL